MAHCKRGNGLIKVNGRPLEMIEPRTLQCKLLEPVLRLGKERFAGVDIRVRVKGGGHVAQIYGESQELDTWVGGGSESKAFPLDLHKADTTFFVCFLHSNPSVHLQGPGGLLPEMWVGMGPSQQVGGGVGAKSRTSSGIRLASESRRTLL